MRDYSADCPSAAVVLCDFASRGDYHLPRTLPDIAASWLCCSRGPSTRCAYCGFHPSVSRPLEKTPRKTAFRHCHWHTVGLFVFSNSVHAQIVDTCPKIINHTIVMGLFLAATVVVCLAYGRGNSVAEAFTSSGSLLRTERSNNNRILAFSTAGAPFPSRSGNYNNIVKAKVSVNINMLAPSSRGVCFVIGVRTRTWF